MRFILSIFLCFFTALLFSQQISSHFTPRERGWATFGIDGGSAYQSSDVRTSFDGWGAGMTLAKNLAYRPGGALSFDIRGRLLFTRAYGRDWKPVFEIKDNAALNGSYKPSIDYVLDQSLPFDSSFVFANHRTGMGELGAEGVLTFNRLRERTGIVFSLFGGVGLDLYRTRIDQADASGNRYDYLSVNRSNGKANTLSALHLLRDNVYESRADGSTNAGIRAGIMPGAGLELGYQLTKNFVFGIGHKITFSRTDVLDGQRWHDSGIAQNDWAHYTNFFMRWDISRSNHSRSRAPEIDITDPNRTPYISESQNYFIKADIKNVEYSADIRCYLNGEMRPFDFRKGHLGSSVRLAPGRNEFRIEASNPAGQEAETVVIVWEDRTFPPPPPPSMPLPVVRITNPSYSPFKSDKQDIYFRAQVDNVREKRDLKLIVNGAEESRFTMAEGLEASLRLREGRNVVRVEAINPAGRASDEVVIEVNSSVTPPPPPPSGRRPVVTINQPSASGTSTNEKNYPFRGTVVNADSRDAITLLLNGTSVRDFDFSPRSGEVTASLDLAPADNKVILRARNSAGEAEAQTTIIRKNVITPPAKKPEVTITTPTNGAAVDRPDAAFSAITRNVISRNEVIVVFNGVPFNAFDFNDRSQTVSGNLNLKEGENTLTVKVTNSAGSNESTVRVRYNKAVPKPIVQIVNPLNGAEFKEANAELRAKLTNVANRSEISVSHNGRAVSIFDFNASTGQVSTALILTEGDNNITVKASTNGGSSEASVRVRYNKPALKPTVQIINPADGAEFREASAELRATVANVANKNEITVYLNGRPVTVFDFNDRSGQVAAKVTLGEGENSIRIAARNNAGADEKTVKVRLIPVKKPTVVITAPGDRTRVSDPNATLTAKTTNIFSDKNVVVKLNNLAIKGFTLDRSGIITAPLTLKEGQNIIYVQVSTPDGIADASVTIVYASNVEKPTITFLQPGAKNTPVTKSAYQFKVKVTGVQLQSDIKVKFNGKENLRGVSFNAKTGELTYPGTLVNGKNTLTVEAKNTGGSANASADVTFNALPSGPVPEVKIRSASNPTVDPQNPTVAKTSIVADLKNVTEKSQITVVINGKALPNFNFNATTGLLTGAGILQRGTNKIVVSAKTPAGEDSDSTEVIW